MIFGHVGTTFIKGVVGSHVGPFNKKLSCKTFMSKWHALSWAILKSVVKLMTKKHILTVTLSGLELQKLHMRSSKTPNIVHIVVVVGVGEVLYPLLTALEAAAQVLHV